MTATLPRVSVVMGTYNRAHMIDRSIESLRRQTLTDWELIIADDASTDNTAAVVAAWADREPRIVAVRSEVNGGTSRTYNRAFALARAPYIAMLDDDDVWCVDDKLARQVEFLDSHPEYVGCGGGMIVVDPQGSELYRYLKPETDERIRSMMLFANPMANSTTMFRRDAGEKAGWYEGAMRFSGDRDFWMKMALLGKLHNFQECLGYYTRGNQNSTTNNLKPHLKTSLMITRRYRKQYPNYLPALAVNYAQYWYSFLPRRIQRSTHTSVVRMKHVMSS